MNRKQFKRKNDNLKKAENLIKLQKYKEAIEELNKTILPSVDYYLLLAEAYEGLGKKEEAERYLEEARFLEGEIRSKRKINAAINLVSKKKFLAAEKELLESIELNPFDKSAYVTLYNIYREMGAFKKQLNVLEQIKTIDPYDAFPYLELGRLYSLRKNYQKAVASLEEGISRIKNRAELHFELGKVLAEAGKLEEAEKHLNEACSLDLKNVEYRQKLAEVLVNKEDYGKALEVVLDTLELFPDATYVMQSAAALYDLIGNEELAEYYYRLAASRSSGFMREDSLKLLSEFFVEKERYDDAEEILKELIETSENSWIVLDAFAELSIILFEQERFFEIVNWGKKVLGKEEIEEEEYCEVAEIVADALFEEKRFEEALKTYNEILSKSRDEKLIKRVYSKAKETEEILSLEDMLK